MPNIRSRKYTKLALTALLAFFTESVTFDVVEGGALQLETTDHELGDMSVDVVLVRRQ